MNLNITPIKYNQHPTFGTTKIYKEFKQIPNLTCACCGGKMIPTESLENIFKTITQPLSKLIKKGLFNNFVQNIPIIAVLTNLAVKFPNDSLDKILCDRDNKKEYSKVCFENGTAIKDISRSELRSASVVLKRISPFKDCLHKNEKEIYDLLCAYASEHPRKSLSEIVQLDEVQDIHSVLYTQTKTKIEKLNKLHLDKIKKLIKTENTQLNTDNIIETVKEIMEAKIPPNYKDYQLIKYLENSLKDKVNPKTIKKIQAEAQNLQELPSGADYFFVQAKRKKYNDYVILQQIINPSIATFEHIKPKANGGRDSINNGLILCKNCNNIRKTIPYSEFIEYNPQMPYNTQKQILQISDLILHGRIAGYCKDWPIKVASTLYKSSDRKFNVNLDSYCEKASKKYGKELAKREREITVAQEELTKEKKEIKKLEKQLQKLYSSTNALRQEISNKSAESQKDKALLKQIKTFIEKN